MKKKVFIAELLFSLGFTLLVAGILVRINPEYTYNLLSLLGFESFEKRNDSEAIVNIFGAVETLLGGLLLSFSGFWIYRKRKKSGSKD